MTDKERRDLIFLGARIGSTLTDEQMELASDLTKPVISISNPGTGKSHTIIFGLINAQTYKGISGRNINAMSFTKAATAELKSRYDVACKKCGITPTVTFNTFHSICYTIVREVYPDMRIFRDSEYSDNLKRLREYAKDEGCENADNLYYMRRVLDAIDSLNAELVFDEANVLAHYAFKTLDMPLKVFLKIRGRWFNGNRTSRAIAKGDIPIVALYCLLTVKGLSQKYREQYKVMVVDEFQDLSLLHLKILSLIAVNLVAVGDMKQQIYGFNGASHQIIEAYLQTFPNAKRCDLTQSFRCRNEIAEYATRVYRPNDPEVKTFSGVGDGGSVKIVPSKQLDLKSIVTLIKEEQDSAYSKGTTARDVLFLYRNNASVTPVAEELYRQGAHFRVNKFKQVCELPIFKELCMYTELVLNPEKEKNIANIPILFPEFGKRGAKNPGSRIFDEGFPFKEESSRVIMAALRDVKSLVESEATAGKVFNKLLPIYEKFIIDGKWYLLDMKREFYFDLVAPIVNNKSYLTMMSEEMAKYMRIEECNRNHIGVRCYTVHSAKGLEADDVYLLDTEDNLYPSEASMHRYYNADCLFEASKDLRNERNLLFVAITRAKDNVYITFRDAVTSLILSPNNNKYSSLDTVYKEEKIDYDDVDAFLRLNSLDDFVKSRENNKPAETVEISESTEEGLNIVEGEL